LKGSTIALFLARIGGYGDPLLDGRGRRDHRFHHSGELSARRLRAML
jgi:hypothetical protein